MTKRAGKGQRVHLWAPGLLGPVPGDLASIADRLSTPALSRCLGRARHRRDGGLAGLCRALGVRQTLAAGPLAYLGRDGEATDSVIYRARPCHLRPDRDRVLVFAGGEIEPDAEEGRALSTAFNEVFSTDGVNLSLLGGDWFLTMPEALAVEPAPLERLAGRYLDEFLGDEAIGAGWRRFLNETQMLFHGLTLNERRASRQQPEVNGLWLWGGGRLPSPISLAMDRACTDDALCRGLARLGGIAPEPGVDRLSQLGAVGTVVLASWTQSSEALLAGDANGWLASLADFEECWAVEGWSALRNASCREFVLHDGAGMRVLTPLDRYRIWARTSGVARHVRGRGSA